MTFVGVKLWRSGAVLAAAVPLIWAATDCGAQQDPILDFLNALGGQPQQQQSKPGRQQQPQQGDPFASFMQGLFGTPAQEQQGGRQGGGQTVAPGTGDPLAAALRQIDVAKEIKAKGDALQAHVADVIRTVKIYQAVNGAMWMEIGKQVSALNKLDDHADAVQVKQFITATEQKRNAYRGALKSVSLNPAADIAQSNQTLAANTQKVSMLRQSVAAMVDSQAAKGSFESLVRQQNVPLDQMMKAYILRIEDTVAAMDAADAVFSSMSREYQTAHGNMTKAIAAFEEQGSLVAAESAKQAGILALEIARMSEIVNRQKDNAFGVILGVVQGIQILSDLQSMSETLGAFQQTMDWFDKNSQQILAASQAARQELVMSVQTLKTIRPALMASWQDKIAKVGTVAKKERSLSVAFGTELQKSLARAKAKAPAMAKQDLDEMSFMKKKSLRS